MLTENVTIINNVGLHARPATLFVQKASSYMSSIWVEKDDRSVNAKSLLGVLSLGIINGMGDNNFVPGGDATRAQTVVMLTRLQEVLGL